MCLKCISKPLFTDYLLGALFMINASGIKKVEEVITTEEIVFPYIIKGGRKDKLKMDENRHYIVPGYQRELKWSAENVQVLIDDLMNGSKFLGTITFSTTKKREYEIIDGQQRLTIITLLITFLNQVVESSKQVLNLCKLTNNSFRFFYEALSYQFNYEKIKEEDSSLFEKIINDDVLDQRFELAVIWECISERLSSLSKEESERFLLALRESELNVIVNQIPDTDTQKKFCVDYFIDINNKSVDLDYLDIIRAYAFKEDFVETTTKWINIQTKCKALSTKAKYTRETLYYHYFICNVNKNIDNEISKISKDFKIRENINISGKKYSSGTYIWDIITNGKFYTNMLKDLDEFLDFIDLVVSSETGGTVAFKKFFEKKGKKQDETVILNAHTIINSILRNDDIVPKMLVMKYYFDVLKPVDTNATMFKTIKDINIVASVFTLGKKRKSSDLLANKIIKREWKDDLRNYATKCFLEIPKGIEFDKVICIDRKYTRESGLLAARRFLSLVDSCSYISGNLSYDDERFKNETNTSGKLSMEHFIINREYTYALYMDDGKTKDIEITLPAKHKKYIATLANYILMDSETNKSLKNRPVYEKIEMLEKAISEKGIDTVIPGSESQRHYRIIREYMYEKTAYPKGIKTEKDQKKRINLLEQYYRKEFKKEYDSVINSLLTE